MTLGRLEEGTVETLPGTWAPPGSRPVELVFRTVGERTSRLALELALRHIRPHRAHVVRDVKPFALAVRRMLGLEHRASHVVHLDADCLVLEDMRPFLDANDLPYVDCYVDDRFRGRVHCGVHITRTDVLDAMRAVPEPEQDLAYVLRPESRLRNLALASLGLEKQLKSFHILHDHFQHHGDIFCKYALRELRSRTDFSRRRLALAMARWGEGDDLTVARHAVEHARRTVPADAKPKHVELYIRNLPYVAQIEIERLGLAQTPELDPEELARSLTETAMTSARPKIFGLGLSRTGTRSLTAALHVLGFDTVHYPIDRSTLDTLARGDARFPLLEHYDGLTDITTIPYFAELDRLHPGAKFVLTVREPSGWLASCRNHWAGRPSHEEGEGEAHRVHMEVRRFLRAAVYGAYEMSDERFLAVYARHVEAVRRHFTGRPGDLLELDLCGGQGWEKLAPFLGAAIPAQPFPHKGRKLGEKLAEKLSNLEVDD